MIVEDGIAEIPLLCNRGRSIDDANDDDDDDDGTGDIQIYTIDELLKFGAPNGSIPEQTDQEGKKGNEPESIPKALGRAKRPSSYLSLLFCFFWLLLTHTIQCRVLFSTVLLPTVLIDPAKAQTYLISHFPTSLE